MQIILKVVYIPNEEELAYLEKKGINTPEKIKKHIEGNLDMGELDSQLSKGEVVRVIMGEE